MQPFHFAVESFSLFLSKVSYISISCSALYFQTTSTGVSVSLGSRVVSLKVLPREAKSLIHVLQCQSFT